MTTNVKIEDITEKHINDVKTEKNSTKNLINDKLDKLLLELKIISNIKEYDKICVRDNIMIDTPYLLQSVARTYNGDSREKSIKYIQKIIDDIFEILDNLLEDAKNPLPTHASIHYYSNKSQMEKVDFKDETITIYQKTNQNLTESISGLQNLKITYLNDISTTAKLDMLIVKIQNRINKINSMMVLKN